MRIYRSNESVMCGQREVLAKCVKKALNKASNCVYLIGFGVALVNPLQLTIAQEDSGEALGAQKQQLEIITVTARKRQESILEIPLSIQAFSAADLQAGGTVDLESLANNAPNLDFQNVGNSQPGRYNSAVRFRGMDTAITVPTNQTGAFFVDGVNVLGGASSVSFSDIARVEVIRGPQPVFFGRGTFGGAINYITVDPSEEFGGHVSASHSPTFGSNDFNAYVEGALNDNLTARITAFSRTQGAAFTATDGGELGKETTTGVSAIFSYWPTDKLHLKARVAYSEDDDGPASATHVQYGTGLGNIAIDTPITINTSDGVVTTNFARTYFSGDVPVTNVSSNTRFYDVRVGTDEQVNVGDIIKNLPFSTDTPSLDHVGLRTDMLVSSLAVDFDYSDALTISGMFGYNDRSTTQIRDADLYDNKAWMLLTALNLESWSAEARFAYDDGGPLRYLAGVNYAKADQFGDIDGGYGVWDGLFGTLQIGEGGSSLEVAEITTLGIFASFEYDILDNLTAAVEMRYQEDESKNKAGWYNSLVPSTDLQFNEFLPRVSITAKPTDDTTIYVSYAEGTLPGSVNNAFARLTEQEAIEAREQFPDVLEELDSENLEAYELGWKQTLFDQSLWFSLVGFYQQWDGMKGSSTFTFVSPSSGETKLFSTTLVGSSTQKGIELETRWYASANLVIHGAYGYTRSVYDNYAASSLNSTLGLPRGNNYLANGNTLPRSPEHSGAINATWTDRITADWDYYLRGDIAYRGETFTDELNLTTIAAYTLMNFRVGLQQQDGVMLELYCSNCLDEGGWATGRRLTDFGTLPANFFTNQGAVVDPITPREIGVRFSYNF